MSTKHPSIREIASLASVSPSTVSRILSGRPGGVPVTEQTRARVLKVCRDLRYEPNIHARRLFSRRSGVIAFVAPPYQDMAPDWYSEPSLGESLAGAVTAANEQGVDVLLLSADSAFVSAKKYLTLFRSRSVDGMLIWGVRLSETYVVEMKREGLAFVLVNNHTGDPSMPSVVPDQRGASAAVARRLLTLGHRRMAYITDPVDASVYIDRREGFLAECLAAGARVDVREGDCHYESGLRIGRELLSRPAGERPTAVASLNDLMAMGVIEAAASLGLKTPQDVSVTGGDGTYPYYRPRLTTFRMPMLDLGRRGAEMLLRLVEAKGERSGGEAAWNEVLPVALIDGDTVAPPARPGLSA